MPDKDKKDGWEEKPVTELIRERGEHFHRRGRKPQSLEDRHLSRNALRLLRHIRKVTPKENPIWSESIGEVAKRLGMDPSTVKRLRRRLWEVGVLAPREREGGRGKWAQYEVNLEKAETLIREGVWGAAKKGGEKGAQKLGQETKPAQEIPPTRPPSPPVGNAPAAPKLPPSLAVTEIYPALLSAEESLATLLKETLFLGGCALGIAAIYWIYKEYGTLEAIAVGTCVGLALYCVFDAWRAPQPVHQPQTSPPPPATTPRPTHWSERIRVI